jgi:hypothetical protein
VPLPLQQPERISWTCPLGLRFYDAASGEIITSGLDVTATRNDLVAPVVRSLLTPSGVHAFHRLFGLPVVDPPDRADPWHPSPKTLEFRIEVTDSFRRFLPCTFLVPAPSRGLGLPLISGSPPTFDNRGIPLFSAPERKVPTGFVMVRASLRGDGGAAPAAWAMLEIHHVSGAKNLTTRGMADAKGEMLALFRVPEGPRRDYSSSPPKPDDQPSCPVTLAFFHQTYSPLEETADYGRRLTQPSVRAFREGSPPAPFRDALLELRGENNLPPLELAAP